jgi:hypothetical protein
VSVGESSDDNLRAVPAQRHGPTDAWLEAFNTQCTEAMLKRLRRYALLLARCPGGEQLGDLTAYAEEVTQAVVTDVADGVLRWEPSARELEPYLTDVIRLRVRRDRKRAARYPHLSLDAVPPRDRAPLLDEVDSQLASNASARGDDHDADARRAMTATLGRIRRLVAADPLALRFLDAFDQGAATRGEIMKVAGFTRAEYHNTRRRLARLFSKLHLDRRAPAKDN